MDFDALRAAVVPGGGVVGRWPGVICVAECADRTVLRRLLDVCASAVGAEPGRMLARKLAMWLGSQDAPGDGLRFGTVAVTGAEARAGAARGEQWAVFLYGPVGLVVPDRQVALSGAQSVAWTDRLLSRPDAPVVLALEGGPIPPGVVDGVHDLRAGIVPGAGAVLVPGGEPSTGEATDEPARSRPDESGLLDSPGAPERSPLPSEPAPTVSAEGLYQGEGPGNATSPPRGGLGAVDGYGDHEGGTPGLDRPSGRAHLRPVPSGTNGSANNGANGANGTNGANGANGANGVAHRDWVPRRGTDLDVGRSPDAERERGVDRAGDDPTDPGPPSPASDRIEPFQEPGSSPQGHDEPHRPGIGDEYGGHNGSRTNGSSYDLLGGSPGTAPQEPERSPWSDGRGRDVGRPERIEGWFATRADAGTESDLSALGSREGRRPRHGRRDEDALLDSDAPEAGRNGSAVGGELEGAFGGDPGAAGVEVGGLPGEEPGLGSGEFGAGGDGARAADARLVDGGVDAGSPPAAEELDGSGEGTPRLGVPRTEPDAPPDSDPGADREAPNTTALRSERILGASPGEADGPARDDGATGGLVVDSRQEEQQVHGYPCARGHLNDPRVQVCALCGLSMEEQAGPPVAGARPPLGLVVFEDGATYTVDAEYLLGRMPEADSRVTSGEVRPLALEDTSGAVSRVHAQLVLDGWDALVVDAGSRNGTFVCPPGEQGWSQLPAGESYRLVPGARVRIGGRSFVFESPSGVH